ncbi:MAG TPA: molybdate ABC transporter substrate-binding protein [Spirochaetota bacterium]|nr:molybdate ABC transporter substrate-binding protein [Spirochaetota bacterium]HPJ34407.1 molybdate ABC transporter substrate-binding protein [Spirochaetota bacterium]
MKKSLFKRMISLLIAAVFFIPGCGKDKPADLVVFSGAGLIKPVGELITAFEKKEGVKINAHYGGSGEIFGMIGAGQYCDILIPGAEKYTEDALKNGWVKGDTIKKIVLHEPTIAVPAGNPGKISSLSDLAKPGVKVAIGDPKGPAIGRITKKILEKNKLWDKIQKNVTVKGPTVNQLVIYPALKQVDATIVWKDVTAWAKDKEKIEVVQISKKENIIKTIPTAVTTKSKNQELALKFNDFITSEEGMKVWQKWGFEPCAK